MPPEAGGGGVHALETECLKVRFFDKDIDDSHRIVFADIGHRLTC
jgi:hypothetical protein